MAIAPVVTADSGAALLPGKDLVIRIAIAVTLFLYVIPVYMMLIEASGLLSAVVAGKAARAGVLSNVFVTLIAAPNGPLALLQKGVGILASGGIVASLSSRRDWILETIILAIVGTGMICALVLWAILSLPNVYKDVWESAGLDNVKTAEAFISIRDTYFSNIIESLLTFGAIYLGIKLTK